MATRLDGKMIIWTASLVIATGAIGVMTMLQPPDGFAENEPVLASPLASVAPVGREPASINSAVQLEAMSLGGKENIQAVDLTIPCEGVQKSVFTNKVHQLRLKGETCFQDQKNIKSSSIQNAANGYVATVFFPKDKKFITDYISLSNGINRIVIKHDFANGKSEEREYIIEREL